MNLSYHSIGYSVKKFAVKKRQIIVEPRGVSLCIFRCAQLSAISRTSIGQALTQMPQAMHFEAFAMPG